MIILYGNLSGFLFFLFRSTSVRSVHSFVETTSSEFLFASS